jgi:hypothetical protein
MIRVVPLVAAVAAAWPAQAAEVGSDAFALVIGVNRSPDPEVPPLRYADDDAVRYHDLLALVGVRTFLLATLDENTRRVHPEAATEAQPADRARLRATVDAIAQAVATGRGAGRRSTLYVVYAGHGRLAGDGRTGLVSLEDGELRGADFLTEIIDRIRADRAHLIIDACNSYDLVAGRGGGERWPVAGYTRIGGALLERRDVGLLLSTSSARESHEWSEYQAGVFSHEVRSGLYGAADANQDGIISYRELAAFVRRANESIPNERFRPEVFWQPPQDTSALIDLRPALAHRVEIPGRDHGHYFLESPRGVRLADFHNSQDLTVRLVRPRTPEHLYLRRTSDQREYVLRAAVDVVDTSALQPEDGHVSTRSAAHEAFTSLFALPFDAAAVAEVARPAVGTASAAQSSRMSRAPLAWTLTAGAAAAAAVGAGALVSAYRLNKDVGPSTSQDQAARTNHQIGVRNGVAGVAFGVAGACAVGAAAAWLWPERPAPVTAAASANQVLFGWQGRF